MMAVTPALATGAGPTLVGVGMGPGDPELITLKAIRTLAAADAILVPATESSADEAGRAERLVLATCPEIAARIRRVPFSMAQRRGVGTKRRESWEAAAQSAQAEFEAGATTVAFATVGDPSVYSTFSYLAAHMLERRPGVAVEVIPGITAMQALAAASLTPLVEGQESLALVPVTAGLDAFAAALDTLDTVVAYKGGRHLAALLELVTARGRDGVLGENVGLPTQRLTPLSQVDADAAPYFSTVLVAPRRTTPGGRL